MPQIKGVKKILKLNQENKNFESTPLSTEHKSSRPSPDGEFYVPREKDLVGLIVLEMLEICRVGSSDWVKVRVTVMNLVLLP